MPSEVMFFFGAGASIPAGVPDTIQFVKEFRDHCAEKDRHQHETLEAILKVLDHWKKEVSPVEPQVDVELLLEALTRLESKESDLLLRFYEGKQFLLSEASPKPPLIQALKSFIKERAIVPIQQTGYLDSLVDFVEEYHPLDIFTANYDITIEQFCEKFRKVYVDGFEDGWNSSLFDREDTDVRLYKIHGSITWYRTNKGNYVKVLALVPQTELHLVTGEQAETLLLYPLQKWQYAEPFLETLVMLKSKLESARFAIVVGYSFRDDYIRRIFWDAARRNRELQVFLVDPRAPSIYERRLRLYEEGVPSSLSGRVILLPYPFERVLPFLRRDYLANLKIGLAAYKAARENELKGAGSVWHTCIEPLAACEHSWLLEEVLKKADWGQAGWMIRMKTLIRRLTMDIAGSGQAPGGEAAAQLYAYLHEFFVDRLRVESWGVGFEVKFNYVSSNGGASYIAADQIAPVLKNMEACAASQEAMCTNLSKDKLKEIKRVLRNLFEYVNTLSGGKIQFPKYLQLREQACSAQLRDQLELMIARGITPRREDFEPLSQEVASLERQILGGLIEPLRLFGFKE